MPGNSEDQIAEGLRGGDREVWLTLYDAYAEKVWENVARLTRDASIVPDIVQETFLAAARSAGDFDPQRGSLWVWLWTIARRQIALHHRNQERTLGLERLRRWWSSLDGQKQRLISSLEAPLDILGSEELADAVRHCLGRLDAEYQVLLLAKYCDEASAEAIAARLNCSTVAVRSKLARARKAFRRVFTHMTDAVSVSGSSYHDFR